MVYIVITFPLEVRPLMRNKLTLARLGKRARRLLRKRGYERGFTRWHYFGKHGERYHPHLNVLCDGEWLEPGQLDELKTAIRRSLLPRSMANRIGKDLDVNYSYVQTPRRIMHRIKYVTKASFLERSWDEPLSEALYEFHNGCFWGVWDDPPKWKLTGTDKKYNALLPLAEGKHPISGKPIVWNKEPVPWALVEQQNPVDIGGWYYLLPPIREPPAGRTQLTNLTPLADGDPQKQTNLVKKHRERAGYIQSLFDDYDSQS